MADFQSTQLARTFRPKDGKQTSFSRDLKSTLKLRKTQGLTHDITPSESETELNDTFDMDSSRSKPDSFLKFDTYGRQESPRFPDKGMPEISPRPGAGNRFMKSSNKAPMAAVRKKSPDSVRESLASFTEEEENDRYPQLDDAPMTVGKDSLDLSSPKLSPETPRRGFAARNRPEQLSVSSPRSQARSPRDPNPRKMPSISSPRPGSYGPKTSPKTEQRQRFRREGPGPLYGSHSPESPRTPDSGQHSPTLDFLSDKRKSPPAPRRLNQSRSPPRGQHSPPTPHRNGAIASTKPLASPRGASERNQSPPKDTFKRDKSPPSFLKRDRPKSAKGHRRPMQEADTKDGETAVETSGETSVELTQAVEEAPVEEKPVEEKQKKKDAFMSDLFDFGNDDDGDDLDALLGIPKREKPKVEKTDTAASGDSKGQGQSQGQPPGLKARSRQDKLKVLHEENSEEETEMPKLDLQSERAVAESKDIETEQSSAPNGTSTAPETPSMKTNKNIRRIPADTNRPLSKTFRPTPRKGIQSKVQTRLLNTVPQEAGTTGKKKSGMEIRSEIYSQWYQEKMEAAKSEAKEKKEKERQEKLKKEKESKEKKVEAEKSFEHWKKTRGTDWVKEQKRKQQEEIEKQKRAEEQKPDTANNEKNFLEWKKTKDEIIKDKEREKRRKAEAERYKKEEETRQKEKDNETAMFVWKQRKDKKLLEEYKINRMHQREKERLTEERAKEKERTAEEKYEQWLRKKDTQEEKEVELRTQRIQLYGTDNIHELDFRQPWSPASKTVR